MKCRILECTNVSGGWIYQTSEDTDRKIIHVFQYFFGACWPCSTHYTGPERDGLVEGLEQKEQEDNDK